MLCEARRQHVGQHTRHDGGAQRVVEPIETLRDETGIHVEEEVIDILHRQSKVLEPQREGQPGRGVELSGVDDVSLHRHDQRPHESFNVTARLNTGFSRV
jgi:hypothetical protein